MSRCKNMQLDGSVVVASVHHLILGPFPQMIVYPNFTFLLSNQKKISSQSVSSLTYTTSKHPSNLMLTVSSTQQHLQEVTMHLSLVRPHSTINSRRYSFFVNMTLLWNTIPIHILEDSNRNSFRHHFYDYLCVNQLNS